MLNSAVVNYHIKSDEPQAFRFDVDGVVGKLVSPKLVPTAVRVEDIRDAKTAVSFERDGIAFEQHQSQVQNFEQPDGWQSDYDSELRRLLIDTIGAAQVTIFDHTVRIDDPAADRKPARNVHSDYSTAGAEQRLVDILGAQRAEYYRQRRFGFVNVWRPVERPIMTSPLGFIRPSSVAADDWMTIELIYPERNGQILGLAANDRHEWFYLSQMTPTDVAIFNIYDNRKLPVVAHSALDMQGAQTVTGPRKSIESRTLVLYE